MLVKNVKSRRGALHPVDMVGSFNGRTGAFEASDDGSTPSPTTTRLKCGKWKGLAFAEHWFYLAVPEACAQRGRSRQPSWMVRIPAQKGKASLL